MDGAMAYEDEDGNLIMYNHDEMGEDDDMDGQDDYGMEGSPGVSRYNRNIINVDRTKKSTSKRTLLSRTCLLWIKCASSAETFLSLSMIIVG